MRTFQQVQYVFMGPKEIRADGKPKSVLKLFS